MNNEIWVILFRDRSSGTKASVFQQTTFQAD